jgi:hypothetical protein
VAWFPIKKMMKVSTIQTRHCIIKGAARDCGEHAVLFQRHQRKDNKCPFCGLEKAVIHVYKCQHREVQDLWEKSIEELQRDLANNHASRELIQILWEGLRRWQKDAEQVEHSLCQMQSMIGWEGILEGYLGTHWQEYQEEYYQDTPYKKSGLGWSMMIIRKLWRIAWTLWEHRNKQAHLHDKANEKDQLQLQVESELVQGTQLISNLETLLSELELERVRGTHSGYIKSWLRNVRARRRRATQQLEDSRGIQLMRATVQRFLNLG